MRKLKDKVGTSLTVKKGFCALVFVALSSDAYNNPERIADNLAKHEEVESVDIVAGNWELLLEVRTKDQDEFYDFLNKVIRQKNGIVKINSVISLKRIKPT